VVAVLDGAAELRSHLHYVFQGRAFRHPVGGGTGAGETL
jgi:hypothetical protein